MSYQLSAISCQLKCSRMQDFRRLAVWRRAHELTLIVYRATARFPRHELYGLTNQLRRGVISVASNIAEGSGRGSDADFGRCLRIAFGSASELEYQLLLARDLSFLDSKTYEQLTSRCTEVKRMLSALIRKVTS